MDVLSGLPAAWACGVCGALFRLFLRHGKPGGAPTGVQVEVGGVLLFIIRLVLCLFLYLFALYYYYYYCSGYTCQGYPGVHVLSLLA